MLAILSRRSLSALTLKTAVLILTLALIGAKSDELKNLDFVLGDSSMNFRLIIALWLTTLAPSFYLCALWSVGTVFEKVHSGGRFGPAMIRLVRDVGRNLLIGASAALVIAPVFTYLLINRPPALDLTAIIVDLTIALVGTSMFILARSGERLRAELEEIL